MPWDRAQTFAIRIRRLIVARPIYCTAHLTEQTARSLPSDCKYSLFNPNHCRWCKNHVPDVVGVSRKVSKKKVSSKQSEDFLKYHYAWLAVTVAGVLQTLGLPMVWGCHSDAVSSGIWLQIYISFRTNQPIGGTVFLSYTRMPQNSRVYTSIQKISVAPAHLKNTRNNSSKKVVSTKLWTEYGKLTIRVNDVKKRMLF